jgi:hypothetical protein
MRSIALFALALSMVGCQPAPSGKDGPEEDPPLDGAFDSFRSPTEHGELLFGRSIDADITDDDAFHAWTFTLTGPARVDLRIGLGPESSDLDTVMYVYREGERGWGAYIARNDDAGPYTQFSGLSLELDAGRYRVLVKGYDRRVTGDFALDSACMGEGCPVACLFGHFFQRMRDSATFDLESTTVMRDPSSLDAAEQAQLVAAVRIAYAEAADVAAALLSVEAQEVNRLVLRERATDRRFVALEYGARGASHGAVFEGDSPAIVAEIHAGEIRACTILGRPQGGRTGTTCIAEDPCGIGLLCVGETEVDAGRCTPAATLEGEGEPCSASGTCGDALVCTLARVCVAAWKRGTIGESSPLEIPDAYADGLTRQGSFTGLAPRVSELRLRATFQHTRPSDLAVTIEGPDGIERIVASELASTELDVRVAGFRGELANGTWTVRFDDGRPRGVGTVESWSLELTSED